VRLDLTWRADPPRTLPPGADQAVERAVRTGRRWSLRLPADEATRVLTALLNDPASSALDDFSLTTVSLEDVVLAGDQR
jgi:ABC-2 type transport system ATP-binding protein